MDLNRVICKSSAVVWYWIHFGPECTFSRVDQMPILLLLVKVVFVQNDFGLEDECRLCVVRQHDLPVLFNLTWFHQKF